MQLRSYLALPCLASNWNICLKPEHQKIKANEKENLPFTKAIESVFRVREVSYGRLEFLSVCLWACETDYD